MLKEQEILENNKLIAEYFGAIYKADDYGDFGYLFDKPFVENWHTMFRPDSMKFHTSWDWLIPVVEKIEAMEIKGGFYSISITKNHCVIYNMQKVRPHVVSRAEADTKLSATYQAVVNFIKQVKG